MMSDRRIVRGNTYSGNIGNGSGNVHIRRRQLGNKTAGKHKQLLPEAKLSQLGMDPLTSSRRRRQSVRREGGVWSVPPVPGRRHMDLQTDSWLEEISDKREEKEMGTQVKKLIIEDTLRR